jgi:FAR-17a/AIG1-like protein
VLQLCRLRNIHDVADISVHFAGGFLCLLVFIWHFSEAAARLPGARGFGWFFKYLTFWGWTLQTVQYNLTALFTITSPVRPLLSTTLAKFSAVRPYLHAYLLKAKRFIRHEALTPAGEETLALICLAR